MVIITIVYRFIMRGLLSACIALSSIVLVFAPSITGATELYEHGDPSDIEQLLLERINATRANPGPVAARLGVKLADSSPRQPLVLNAALQDAAESHSAYLISSNQFSHLGRGNSNAQQRMAAFGYPFGGGYEGWAENLGLYDMAGQTQESAVQITQDLIFKSADHRQWLLQPFFREMGLGVVYGSTKVRGSRRDVVVVTEKFASSGASPTEAHDGSFLQGVVYDDANDNGRYDLGEGKPGVTISPSSGHYHTVTSSSGGYALPMSNHHGALTLTFADETFSHPITISMTGGHNSKVDLRWQDVPVPDAAVIVSEPDAAPDPSIRLVEPIRITETSDRELQLALPAFDRASPMTLQFSRDLQTWKTVEINLTETPQTVPMDGTSGYYRLIAQ